MIKMVWMCAFMILQVNLYIVSSCANPTPPSPSTLLSNEHFPEGSQHVSINWITEYQMYTLFFGWWWVGGGDYFIFFPSSASLRCLTSDYEKESWLQVKWGAKMIPIFLYSTLYNIYHSQLSWSQTIFYNQVLHISITKSNIFPTVACQIKGVCTTMSATHELWSVFRISCATQTISLTYQLYQICLLSLCFSLCLSYKVLLNSLHSPMFGRNTEKEWR